MAFLASVADGVGNVATYTLAFLFVLTVVVFVHELGHFLVARWCGVAVKAFSIGFGREVWGFYDSHGTRWRLGWIPLGGYVKFMDDENAASVPSRDAIGRMTAGNAGPAPVAAPNRFLFMLLGADTSGDDRARAEAYRQWAVDQRSSGRQVSGERLANSGLAVVRNGSSPVIDPEMQGFFVISAADMDEATAVARSSPHVQGGGLIIVRPIDTP